MLRRAPGLMVRPMTTTTPLALLREPGEGDHRWQLGMLLTFKALGPDTGGRLWALEGRAPFGAAPPLHVHTIEDELWFILEGRIELTAGDTVHELGPGGFAYVPRGAAHTFRVTSQEARWFGLGTPAGLDGWFYEASEPATSPTLPPPPDGPPDIEALIASLQRYGTETLGPPPA